MKRKTKTQASRIEELERRVRELEARPPVQVVPITVQPWPWYPPTYVPYQPYVPYPWTIISGGATCGSLNVDNNTTAYNATTTHAPVPFTLTAGSM